ncbi:phosphate ABC transporter substrate-binding protein, PhoT family [Nitrosospira sp. Nsp11]|uniref:PstS family phosphate ABC transporter substrate-binding protein n=2 Tax=unclassified Nitrosospira TaxID=2609267 RepID=UPI00087F781D|nr:phosphate ABC transporter substrate-binding protein, PhoT family [Nitrosospira sp. Nsp18]SHL22701.1 phosphate ABC transporter substrate-binding protein, PhoT family [Nitrosospira sp. Nsp11]
MLNLPNSNKLGMSVVFAGLISINGIAGADAIVKIDGSSTVYPITEAVAEDFQKERKGAVKVTVGISGTGGGFKKFCRGETDIVNASRPILKKEMDDCKKMGIQYVEMPIAFDALTVVVNPKNDWSKTITVAELKKIWEPAAQGKITKWSQVNPTWPDETIKLYGAGADSGTFDYFTEAIVGKAKSSRGDFTASEDDNVLVQGVASDKNGLGFFGFAYYAENKKKLKVVAIDAGKGAVVPSAQTVEDGTYQPLSRPVFIYVNIKSAERPEVRQLIEFYMKNAPALVQEVKFFSLPAQAYATNLKHFAEKKVGTVFGGKPEVNLRIEEVLNRETSL